MNYGWLDIKPAGSQSAGFFIDEDNRILYWPFQDGPGYELDYTAAKQIQEIRSSYVSHWIPNLLMIPCYAAILYLWPSVYAYVEPVVGRAYFGLLLGLGTYFTFLSLFWLLVGKSWFLQDLNDLLRENKHINLERPVAQRLKPSEWLPKWAIIGVLLLVTVVAVKVLLISQKPADYLLSFALVSTVYGRMAWNQWYGLKLRDIRLYEPST